MEECSIIVISFVDCCYLQNQRQEAERKLSVSFDFDFPGDKQSSESTEQFTEN